MLGRCSEGGRNVSTRDVWRWYIETIPRTNLLFVLYAGRFAVAIKWARSRIETQRSAGDVGKASGREGQRGVEKGKKNGVSAHGRPQLIVSGESRLVIERGCVAQCTKRLSALSARWRCSEGRNSSVGIQLSPVEAGTEWSRGDFLLSSGPNLRSLLAARLGRG